MGSTKPVNTWREIAIPMETEKDNQRQANLFAALRSGNRTAILATLQEIRREGDLAVLPALFDLLLEHEDEQVLLETRALLNDLKDPGAAEILAGAVGNRDYADIRAALVAACWQNGLSYGKHLEQFVDAALEGDYMTAMEAFTVIEEAVGEVDEGRRKKAADRIRAGLPEADQQKRILLEELVRVIDQYQSPV